MLILGESAVLASLSVVVLKYPNQKQLKEEGVGCCFFFFLQSRITLHYFGKVKAKHKQPTILHKRPVVPHAAAKAMDSEYYP